MKAKKFNQLNKGDKIYIFEWYMPRYDGPNYEDREDRPWAFIGNIGEHVVGCPYLSQIEEYPVNMVEERTTIDYCMVHFNNKHKGIDNGGYFIENEQANKSVCIHKDINIVPIPGNGTPVKGIRVLATSYEKIKSEWSHAFMQIESALEYAEIEVKLWQKRLWEIDKEFRRNDKY